MTLVSSIFKLFLQFCGKRKKKEKKSENQGLSRCFKFFSQLQFLSACTNLKHLDYAGKMN